MKIAYYSDLHIDQRGNCPMREMFPDFDRLVADGVKAVVLAGDIANRSYDTANYIEDFIQGLKGSAHGMVIPVFFVPGNHEYYNIPMEVSYEVFHDIERHHKGQFYYMVAGRKPIVIGDGEKPAVNFIGDTLWTDFNLSGLAFAYDSKQIAGMRMNDYRAIYEDFYGGTRLTPDRTQRYHREAIKEFVDEVANIREFSTLQKIVVISHMAPTYESIHEHYRVSPWDTLNPAYASSILDKGKDSYIPSIAENVDLWIHGHVHNTVDVQLERTRVVSNPRGYTVQGGYDRYKEPRNENEEFSFYKYVEV